MYKPYQNELQDHQNKSFYFKMFILIRIVSAKKFIFLFLSLVRFIRLANIFHTISEKPIDIISKCVFS